MLVELWDGRLEIQTEEVASYIRCDNDEQLMQTLMEAAVAQIRRFLGDNNFLDADLYELAIPADIKLAIMRLCASFYENRRDDVYSQSLGGVSETFGDMPHSVHHMLQKYRFEVGF
jgi:hypothetical protein